MEEYAEGKEVYRAPADIKIGYVDNASATPGTSDVAQVYEVLAPMAGDYMNAQAEQIGMAQQSMGPLAAATMGQSRTAGLGNYTYNRLMRPQVDVMRDEIRVQGYANQLNRLLSDALNNARNNYNRNGGGTKKTGGVAGGAGKNEKTKTEEDKNKSGGYKHVGVADEKTGQWIDEEESKNQGRDVLSGESGDLSQPAAGFFEWIGGQLGAGTEVGGNAKSIKDLMKKKGLIK